MEFIGWIFCLIVACGATFVTYAVTVISSGFSGKVDKGAIIPLIVALVFWWLVVTQAPFSIVLN